jgi:hypothetical protein
MRIFTPLHVFSAGAAIALLAACSASSTTAPGLVHARGGTRSATDMRFRIPGPLGILKPGSPPIHHFNSFYSCPATGPIEYVSDYSNSVINVYAGTFAGQAPCGQISDQVFWLNPAGLYVNPGNHDLYAAYTGSISVVAYRRGQIHPYSVYTDRTSQYPLDVALTHDGAVVATNAFEVFGYPYGSISTWMRGSAGPKFIGNFPMTTSSYGGFVTVLKNDTIYFDDLDANSGLGLLYAVRCPFGRCGAQTLIAGVSFFDPLGLAHDATGDVLTVESVTRVTADTFELPNPNPSTFPLTGFPYAMAISARNDHWFIADGVNNIASEYAYPGGALIGSVPGNTGGDFDGIAVDP